MALLQWGSKSYHIFVKAVSSTVVPELDCDFLMPGPI